MSVGEGSSDLLDVLGGRGVCFQDYGEFCNQNHMKGSKAKMIVVVKKTILEIIFIFMTDFLNNFHFKDIFESFV